MKFAILGGLARPKTITQPKSALQSLILQTCRSECSLKLRYDFRALTSPLRIRFDSARAPAAINKRRSNHDNMSSMRLGDVRDHM